jgi:hypothetical protein
MPSAIDELIKRRVIHQWINGVPGDKIASDNNIGTGTVSGIINNYKTQLEDSDFDSIRALAAEIRKLCPLSNIGFLTIGCCDCNDDGVDSGGDGGVT